MPEPFLEDAAEARGRLESDFIGDFTNPQVGIEQEVPGALDTNDREIIGEAQGGAILEQPAEIKGAGIDKPGDLSHAQFLGMVLPYEGFGPGDDRRLDIVALEQDPVAED